MKAQYQSKNNMKVQYDVHLQFLFSHCLDQVSDCVGLGAVGRHGGDAAGDSLAIDRISLVQYQMNKYNQIANNELFQALLTARFMNEAHPSLAICLHLSTLQPMMSSMSYICNTSK